MRTEIGYGEIENILEQILGSPVNFEEIVNELMGSGNVFSITKGTGVFVDVLLGQLKNHGQTIASLLLLLISAAVLSNIAAAFRNRQISDMGFYMIYLFYYISCLIIFVISLIYTRKISFIIFCP